MIYLDHSASTPVCDAAKKAIIEHLDDFGNPSSNHTLGHNARMLIEDARERIAKCINADPGEIYFTSGGSEANTLVFNNRHTHSMSSTFEHHSVCTSHPIIAVNKDGFIETDKLHDYLSTWWAGVVSCMMVNNELGTIQPVQELADATHQYGDVLFHIDAVQAVGHIPVNVQDLRCDMLSASAHKFGGPKGTGFLFVKNGATINPLICGGQQESSVRPGTENTLGIIAMASALEDAIEHMEERAEYVKSLRDKMLDRLLKIKGSHLNGSLKNRVHSNINIRFDDVLGSRLVTLCSLYGICISAGSACNEGVAQPSHVLKAIGLSDEDALNSVRITIGHENTEDEIIQAANIITGLVDRIRAEA
jgi:cysteine desulfurase